MTARRRIFVVALLLVFLAGAACADDLTVAAAADLNFALRDLAADFQARTGHRVSVVYGSSGNFFAQIQNGAPFDVFLSADLSYPRQLEQLGLIAPGSLKVYAIGKLVLWGPKTAQSDLQALGMKALLAPGVQQIAIANPRHAPYGRAAVAALQHAGLYDRVKPELVYAENIAQAAHYVESGNADLGLIALSIALSPEMQSKGAYWAVPDGWYPPLEQGAVILKRTRHLAAARAFVDYLKSPAAAAILKRYGFSLPATGPAPKEVP